MRISWARAPRDSMLSQHVCIAAIVALNHRSAILARSAMPTVETVHNSHEQQINLKFKEGFTDLVRSVSLLFVTSSVPLAGGLED